MTAEMTTRERFQAVMNFRPFDRLPIYEWAGWWDKTIERWRSEGLPADLGGLEINRYFEMDIACQGWFGSRKDNCPQAPHHGAGILKDMADYENHYLPHGGLCRNDTKPKLAYRELRNFKAAMASASDGVIDQQQRKSKNGK